MDLQALLANIATVNSMVSTPAATPTPKPKPEPAPVPVDDPRDKAIAALTAQVEALRAAMAASPTVKVSRDTDLGHGLKARVTEKGGIMVTGMEWPVTLYIEQWVKLFSVAKAFLTFAKSVEGQLSKTPTKAELEARRAAKK